MNKAEWIIFIIMAVSILIFATACIFNAYRYERKASDDNFKWAEKFDNLLGKAKTRKQRKRIKKLMLHEISQSVA